MPSIFTGNFNITGDYEQIAAEINSQFKKMATKKKITSVVHCKKDKFDVYIGRPSKWGNPYQIGRDGTREEVIAKYEHWLLTSPMGAKVLKDIHELKGKILGCFCSPNACHGDVLMKHIS